MLKKKTSIGKNCSNTTSTPKHYFEEFRTEHVFFWTACLSKKTRCDAKRYNGDETFTFVSFFSRVEICTCFDHIIYVKWNFIVIQHNGHVYMKKMWVQTVSCGVFKQCGEILKENFDSLHCFFSSSGIFLIEISSKKNVFDDDNRLNEKFPTHWKKNEFLAVDAKSIDADYFPFGQ